jgi:hypothetical protein
LFVNYGLLLFCQVVVALYYVGKIIISFCRAMKYPLLHSCLLDQVSVVGFHAVLVFSGFVLEFAMTACFHHHHPSCSTRPNDL